MRNNTNYKYTVLQVPSTFMFIFISLFLYHFTIANSQSPLIGDIAIVCGSPADAATQDSRKWTLDTDSKFSLLDPTKSSIIFPASPPSVTVPYKTARLSQSNFTYIFPVTPGPKFLRLHFYPTSYNSFSPSTAFFSVKAGPYTLLSNFSAAGYAQFHKSENFFKEFCLNVEDGQTLNLTFSPTTSMSNAYAFINGIEIISMPTNLLYSASDALGYLSLDSNNFITLESNTALELMYRINVGGNYITPTNDKEMFRSWESDEEYLKFEGTSVTPFNDTIQLKYGVGNNLTRFAAPEMVYRTARTMGTDKTTNEKYNLTWTFQVDSNFAYLFRLHFCEFIPLITETQDRVFSIYINTLTAESKADVIQWSGGNGFPVFKDYGLTVGSQGNLKVQDVSIALHPRSDLSLYSDAILNGIEIFKLSNPSDHNLAGSNPDILLTSPPTTATSSTKPSNSSKKWTRIGAVIGGSQFLP